MSLIESLVAHGRTHVRKPLPKLPARLPLPGAPRELDKLAIRRTQETRAYEAANRRLVGKYPTLDMVLRDPDAFVANIKARFEAQRKLTPATPYRFEFGDYALPVMRGWQEQLGGEAAKVRQHLAKQKPGSAAYQEGQEVLAHLADLEGELGRHLKAGRIDYQRFQELAYFLPGALGRYDAAALNLRDRLLLGVDAYLMGDKQVPIAVERARYRQNQVSIFEGPARVESFVEAQRVYEKAFLDKDALRMIVLPTSEALDNDIFMRLAAYDIKIAGVSKDPIAADGFVRPSRIFRLHDDRHNSLMFSRRAEYLAKHKVTPAGHARLLKQIDVWREELNAAVARIQDPELKSAVSFLEFNYHHDRGFMMVPSSYEAAQQDGAYVPQLLYHTAVVARQRDAVKVGFKSPRKTLAKAYDWLRAFWLPRAPQERALLQGKA